ncbi:MAG: cytochrome B [Gammaproteobacteria bacterium]|nr:MAG: cytochrome B [Gammaproteobacteria bacterium]
MQKQIRVWDPLVRLFHWSLVLSFTVAYLSGDENSDIHIYAGYIIAGLITFRLIWGFIGSQHARFSDFLYSPQTIIDYLKSMLSRQPKHYLGHNPAGGAMILALMLGLVVTTYSGLEIYAIEEGAGPLAQQTTGVGFIRSAYADDDEHDKYAEHDGNEEEEEFWEDIHEASANFVLFLVLLHIAGVFIAGKLHNENLVKAMITGNKESE